MAVHPLHTTAFGKAVQQKTDSAVKTANTKITLSNHRLVGRWGSSAVSGNGVFPCHTNKRFYLETRIRVTFGVCCIRTWLDIKSPNSRYESANPVLVTSTIRSSWTNPAAGNFLSTHRQPQFLPACIDFHRLSLGPMRTQQNNYQLEHKPTKR
jgi:hypothetical protein